ncbi:glycosyltransferase [Candidatus Peregrinibacteria bacterium]|nr:glycosyltransferase [Candidatus Peregrinibacteria bacterium]
MPTKHILAFGYHDQQAQRHWGIKKQLNKQGGTVTECHTDKNGLIRKYASLTVCYLKNSRKVNTVLVTFPGHYLMPLAWALTRFPRKKLVFDVFISLWDTIVDDRKKVSKWNPYSWFLYCVDFVSCHAADEILIDTKTHREFFIKKFRINPKKINVLYLGTREDVFCPSKFTKEKSDTKEVLFFGSYIPLQGIEHIIEAAAILEPIEPDIHFKLIGSGQTHNQMKEMAEKKEVKNISFEKRVSMTELPEIIRKSDLCLGIFGTSKKSNRVIPHKVYDALGCGVPVLTRDSDAIRELFAHDKMVTLCKAGDAQDIAEKIQTIFN